MISRDHCNSETKMPLNNAMITIFSILQYLILLQKHKLEPVQFQETDMTEIYNCTRKLTVLLLTTNITYNYNQLNAGSHSPPPD